MWQKVNWIKGNGSIMNGIGWAVDDEYPRVALGKGDKKGFIVSWSYSFNKTSDQFQQWFDKLVDAEAKYKEIAKEVDCQLSLFAT